MSPMTSDLEVGCFGLLDNPYGTTYGEWTVKWWQWALSIPKSISPLIDENGKNADVNQPKKDVWFLAGIFATEDSTVEPHRETTIPYDRSILLPVINCEANPIEYPHLKTEEDLIKHVTQDTNTIVRKDVFVNGKRVPSQRVPSDPPIFTLLIHDDNGLGVKGGTTKAAADGYYVFLKPLPNGEHSISFRGACESGRLNSAASYRVKVV